MNLKLPVALLTFVSLLSAQTAPVPSPAAPMRVCHRFDWNAGHDIPVLCKAGKSHPGLAKAGHALKLGAEVTGTVVLIGGVLYLMALSPAGIRVK